MAPNSYVYRNYRGKTGRAWAFLNSVKNWSLELDINFLKLNIEELIGSCKLHTAYILMCSQKDSSDNEKHQQRLSNIFFSFSAAIVNFKKFNVVGRSFAFYDLFY